MIQAANLSLNFESMPVVVIDTNILLQDPLFKGAHLEKLFIACKKCGYQIVIPGIVRDELIGNVSHRLRQASDNAASLKKTLDGLGVIHGIEPVNKAKELKRYQDHFDVMANKYQIAIAEYPDTSAESLVKSSYACKKPFKASGDGWKDKLVWDSAKAAASASADKKGFLLTNNSSDFCGSEGGLHSDLASDTPDGVHIVISSSAKAFYDEYLATLLAPLKDAESVEKALWEGNLVGFNLSEDLENIVIGLLDKSGRHFDNLQIPLNDTTFQSLQSIDVDSLKVEQLDEKMLNIEVSGDLEIEVVGFMDKWDYYGSLDHQNISLLEGDWNDYVVMASSVLGAHYTLSVLFDQDAHEVKAADIETEVSDDESD
jgi:rRNA-processing protein FCF1